MAIQAPKYLLNEIVTLEVDGKSETKTVAEWCEIKNISSNLVYRRRMRFMSWTESFSKENLKQRSKKQHANFFQNQKAGK